MFGCIFSVPWTSLIVKQIIKWNFQLINFNFIPNWKWRVVMVQCAVRYLLVFRLCCRVSFGHISFYVCKPRRQLNFRHWIRLELYRIVSKSQYIIWINAFLFVVIQNVNVLTHCTKKEEEEEQAEKEHLIKL